MAQPEKSEFLNDPLLDAQAAEPSQGAPDLDTKINQLLKSESDSLKLADVTFGSHDLFLEQRYLNTNQIDLVQLAESGVIAFLGKSRHVDEFYELKKSQSVNTGTYRIRDEGAPEPFVTLKTHGDGSGEFSETVDVTSPDEDFLDAIRKEGELTAVIEKTRVTYKSKQQANCLVHQDSVSGLGEFFDIKADSTESMFQFIETLGLSTETGISESYLEQKKELGISPVQLKFWKFHKRFEDYVLGVVSGTLTPISFLTAAAASGASKSFMLVSLAIAGIGDGLSDAVAASQTVQSKSGATTLEQFKVFGQTMSGKIAIPLTFLPAVFLTSSHIATIAFAASWAAVLLAGTAAVQALAHERNVGRAIGKLVGFGAAAVMVGTAVGKFVPAFFSRWLGE